MSNALQHFSYTLSEEQFVRANWRGCMRNLRTAAIISLVFAVVFLIQDPVKVGLPYLVFVGVYGYWIFWRTKRRARATYRETPSMSEVVNVSLSDSDIEVKSPSHSMRLTWHDVLKWDISNDCFLVYINSLTSLPIPLKSIPADSLKYMNEHLIASGLPLPNKRRK